ncbi:antiviral helicase [Cryptosporidium felis]|nr:antiviral helicase [Cryptosporidium felis]
MFINQEDFWTSDDEEDQEDDQTDDQTDDQADDQAVDQAVDQTDDGTESHQKDPGKENAVEENHGRDNEGMDEVKRSRIRKRWSVEDDQDVSGFRDILGYEPRDSGDRMEEEGVLKYPYELDDFQKRAIINIHRGEHVLVAAHTSAGKTAIAEYAIELANKNGKKAIYTSPIKALSSQKYREFQNRFKNYPAHPAFAQRSRIGIITGDVSINPDAQCVIMTTEILRTMLYRSDPSIEQIQTVIFDEVHYINDLERGVVWEEVIILLDPKVQLVLLSATIPNYMDFANWIGRIKQNTVYCIRTLNRPVPLKHYLYIYEKCFQIMDENNKFNINGYREMLDYIKTCKAKKSVTSLKNRVNKLNLSIPKGTAGEPETATEEAAQGLVDGTGEPGTKMDPDPEPKLPGEDQPTGAQEKSAPAPFLGETQDQESPDNNIAALKISAVNKQIVSTGSFGVGVETKLRTEVYRLQVFLKLLEKNDQLPVILFGFSRRRVEQLAASLSSLNFLYNHVEKSNIVTFIKESTSKLNEADQKIPQLLQCKELALRGIGIHHSGMLPIIKEMTEILFTRGLIKVLFATETISMGINCPARSIVFTGIQKFDGRKNRILLSSEYTQMSGRAGRRGIDTFGNVFIFNSSHETIPECIDIVKMILNTYLPVQSKFRLTYQMILQLSCRHSLTIEDMMTKSFKEMFRAINLPVFQKNLNRKLRRRELLQSQLDSTLESLSSSLMLCNFHSDQTQPSSSPPSSSSSLLNAANRLISTLRASHSISSKLFSRLLGSSVNRNAVSQKIFSPGRLLLFDSFFLTGKSLPMPACILELNPGSQLFSIIVYASEDLLDFDSVLSASSKLSPGANADDGDPSKKGALSSEKFYDVVEESIQNYQNSCKNKQISIIKNLIEQDKKRKSCQKAASSKNDLNKPSNFGDSHSIRLVHHSSFESRMADHLPGISTPNFSPSSEDPSLVRNLPLIFQDLNHYYVFQNVPSELFLFLFDLSIDMDYKNINFRDKTILHSTAILSKSLILKLFSPPENSEQGRSTQIPPSAKDQQKKQSKGKNKKGLKVNLFEFISIQQNTQTCMAKGAIGSIGGSNTGVHTGEPIVGVGNLSENWPSPLPISKLLKTIEIEYFDLLQKHSELYKEMVNNEIFNSFSFILSSSDQHSCSYLISLIVELNKTKEEISVYQHFINDESLDDYPEMKQKIQLLVEEGFLDSNLTITTKGRIASELLTSDELTLVEILLNGMLHKLNNIHEITSVLSCFVFPEKMESSPIESSKIDDRPSLPSVELLNAHDELINIHTRLEKSHYRHHINLDSEHFWSLCNDKFMLIAYKWSNKESLKDIMEFVNNSQINLHEGTIVRTILRLDELVRKLISATKLMGDSILEEKLSQIHENIARDIIFMTSLYFNS